MALRLGDLVVCGEIFNTQNYSVQGWLALRGQRRHVLLHLTGNPDPDLAGRHLRFQARLSPAPLNGSSESDDDLNGLAWQQIGPTGTMTAARQVRVPDCPSIELYRRAQLGELPPLTWKDCLHLEWFSQNGRVVVELVDPIMEFVELDDFDEPLPAQDATSFLMPDEAFAGNQRPGTDDFIDFEDETEIDIPSFDAAEEPDYSEPEDDPYELFSEELQRQWEAEAFAIDQSLDNDDEPPQTIRELELMEELIKQGHGEPVGTIFDGPLQLPSPDRLANDREAERALKVLLAQLALHGIALDICEHYTPRSAYRLLVEHICREEGAYPELRNTQWVQHFMTSEFCEQCEAEFEEHEGGRSDDHPDETDDDSNASDDDPWL